MGSLHVQSTTCRARCRWMGGVNCQISEGCGSVARVGIASGSGRNVVFGVGAEWHGKQ